MRMKTTCKALLCFLLLALSSVNVFSMDEDWDLPISRGEKETAKYGFIAGTEILLSIGTLTAFNYFVPGFSWALPSGYSIQRNLTRPWEWEDQDDFAVNQIGHPLHGLFYFSAGRANGFSFYQSIFFNAFGGVMWETFGESNEAAINDFITTTIGSIAFGEMLYRLYLEACAFGVPAPLAFILNPMAGLHRLFSKWEPPDTGRNLHQLQFYIGGGYAKTQYDAIGVGDVFSFMGPIAEIGGKVVYGNPFEQETKVPYRHFELMVSYGMNFGNYNHLRLISDGYLFSFSPVYSAKDAVSTGLTLHFDFQTHGKFGMEDGAVDQYSNAIDWTLKYRHLFSEDTALELKAHSGFTFFAASKYFANVTVINDQGNKKTDYNNFGAGFNGKLFSAMEYKWGRFELNQLYYIMWTFPETAHFSQGMVYWIFTDLSYYHHINQHFSLGTAFSYAMERGYFNDGYPNTKKSNEVLRIFIAWDL